MVCVNFVVIVVLEKNMRYNFRIVPHKLIHCDIGKESCQSPTLLLLIR
jgi:hypothetical protein